MFKKLGLVVGLASVFSTYTYATTNNEAEAETILEPTGSGIGYINGNTFQRKEVHYDVVGDLAVVEGDIVLGSVSELVASTSGISPFGLVISGDRFRWVDGIMPYTFAAGLPQDTRDEILAAMQHWSTNTNIQFVERTAANQTQYNDFVTFVVGDGCSSFVGRQGGQQNIWLADRCTVGNTIHEIGHALGLWHEQGREDRDQFVQINDDNIQDGREGNFDQHITDGDDIGEYDYGSIMHYGANAFSSNGLPTIVPINPVGAQIGQRNALSSGDINTIYTIYPGTTTTYNSVTREITVPVVNVGNESYSAVLSDSDGDGSFTVDSLTPTTTQSSDPVTYDEISGVVHFPVARFVDENNHVIALYEATMQHDDGELTIVSANEILPIPLP